MKAYIKKAAAKRINNKEERIKNNKGVRFADRY